MASNHYFRSNEQLIGGQRRDSFDNRVCDAEIHCSQYLLQLGLKKQIWSNALAIELDAQGNVKYDVLLRQTSNQNKVIYHKLQDLLPQELLNDDDLHKPDEQEVEDTTESTLRALQSLTQSKISAGLPLRHAEKVSFAQYIRYTPSQSGEQFNSGTDQRIIRMEEVQKDPLEPPRFKTNKKIPQGPPSPPPPVMHSPTRKVTLKEQQEWRIPPCISNWKNSKGYTIPLDKRLAAAGRGLQQPVHINENFAKMQEALDIADRKASEAMETRAQMERKIAQKGKKKKEDHLKQLAQKTREERADIKTGLDSPKEEIRERDQIRYERHKERQRDRNMQRAALEKRTRLERQRQRDISELIALGMANPKNSSAEVQFDQRFFNQSKGINSGFADEDDYGVYDKPWRSSQAMAQNLYRPSRTGQQNVYNDDIDSLAKTSRFVADKEFSGTDHSSKREGPVQFEKQEEEDPFPCLDKFLTEAKANKRPEERIDYENRSSYKKRKD